MINLKNKFLVYGYGISGKSVEKYLINNESEYNIYDDFKKLNHKRAISKKHLLNKINDYDYFVISPSIKIDRNHILYKYKNEGHFEFTPLKKLTISTVLNLFMFLLKR